MFRPTGPLAWCPRRGRWRWQEVVSGSLQKARNPGGAGPQRLAHHWRSPLEVCDLPTEGESWRLGIRTTRWGPCAKNSMQTNWRPLVGPDHCPAPPRVLSRRSGNRESWHKLLQARSESKTKGGASQEVGREVDQVHEASSNGAPSGEQLHRGPPNSER